MPDLVICMIQSDLAWEDKVANMGRFREKVLGLKESSDIVLLPEMFTTGFTMNASAVAEEMDGPTVAWMKDLARESERVIAGSFVCREEGKHYNRFLWMRPDGSFDKYDKKHLFRMADEDSHYSAGNELVLIEHKGWKIRPMVCYDLRFPVWSRNRHRVENGRALAEYDVLLYVANWPEVRVTAWDILLRARAVENQVYCLGVNRVGMDGLNKNYCGHSAAIDPRGKYLLSPTVQGEAIYTLTLNRKDLEDFREKFPQGLDADDFSLSDDV